jgi:hypothetical protein
MSWLSENQRIEGGSVGCDRQGTTLHGFVPVKVINTSIEVILFHIMPEPNQLQPKYNGLGVLAL